MKGIEIAKRYYQEFGKPMLESQFADVINRIAVGIAGEGSECLGFDDEISKDHDFEAGFCLWITREDEAKFGFKLERAYAKLPKEFMGLKRQILSPSDGNRHGVIVIEDFYTRFLGAPTAPDTLERWLYTPSASLLSACNGEVFTDKLGKFSEVRNVILRGYPEDVRRKKLSAHAIMMGQSGQYNYARLIDRKETGAAQLAIFEFVKHAISAVYLLNNKYEPFYKWAYRGMRNLSVLGDLEPTFSILTEMGNSPKQASEKREIIEDISAMLIAEFKAQTLTKATCNNLDTHAYSINDSITDATLRNLHIMDGI